MGKRIVDAPLVEQVDNSQRFPVGAVGDETAHSMSVGQLKEHIIGDSDTPDSVLAMIEDANDRIDKEIEDRQQADRDIEALVTDDIRHIEEAEVERKRNEIARENNEATRRQNEMQRQENERTRQENEQQRIDAEGTRDQRYEEAEEERFQLYNSAESSRTSIFDANESTRQQQEHVRISNENVRNQNEATRNTSETRRQQNENSRIASEDTRQQHEQLRMSAEVERMANESQRVTAERERQSIFNQSQTQRENDFNAAQTLRQTTFENNESERDSLVNAEIERLDQYAITRVELVCDDDQHITLIDDPTPLTYAQVKALVDDTTKFVTLRYLDMWWMLPSYDDGGAIMFTSSDIQGGHVMVTRVILNDDGQMNNYSIVAEDAEHKTDDMSVEIAADGHRTYPTTHAVNGALATKANTDGYYTELTSGMSEQLLSPDGITDEEPYIYRTSAGSTSISTGVAEIKSLFGNSIVWNQKAQVINTYVEGYSITSNGLTLTILANNKFKVVGTSTGITNFTFTSYVINLIKNHKYILLPKYGEPSYGLFLNGIHTNYIGLFECTFDDEINRFIQLRINANTTVDITLDFPQLFDLTQMFGEGNEPTTVEQFKQWFPLDYYEYNAGEIVNVNIDGLRTIGFNQLEENIKASKWSNKIKLIGGQQYQLTFDSVSNATNWRIALRLYTLDGVKITGNVFSQYITDYTGSFPYYNTGGYYLEGGNNTLKDRFFTPTQDILMEITFSAGDIKPTSEGINSCLHLTWSGYRNGDYEAYQEHNINIPVKEIRDGNGNLLFPNGLLSAGSVKDEVTSDKAVKRIGVVDLGDLNWIPNGFGAYSAIVNGINNATPYDYNLLAIGYALDYRCVTNTGIAPNMTISNGNNDGKVFIMDERFTSSDKAKEILQGQYLYYELATPIEVNFKDVPQSFGEKLNLTYFVDDFGTEEFATTEPTAPVKHSTFYMTNLRDKIRNIDGNTDAGALMNGSVDNLLTTLGTALGGTLTKTWDATNKRWTFAFTPNATTLNEEGGEQ